MKKFVVLLCCVATVGTLMYGKISYSKKVHEQVEAAVKGESTPKIEEVLEETKGVKKELLGNFSKEVQDKITEGEDVQVLFVASENHDEFYLPVVQEELAQLYTAQLKIKEVAVSGTTKDVARSEEMSNVFNGEIDILVWEVPLLKDNGALSTKAGLEEVKDVMVKCQEKGIQLVLQPTYPLYKSIYYPKQEEALQKFASENEVAYIDHWNAWPNYTEEAFLEYVTDEKPNEKGSEAWAQGIVEFFSGK